jgi:hypothetical protein
MYVVSANFSMRIFQEKFQALTLTIAPLCLCVGVKSIFTAML